MVRDAGCSDCRSLTSGDCGKHGPLFVTTFHPATIASGGYVPTELDILNGQLAAKDAEIQQLTERCGIMSERNEAHRAEIQQLRTFIAQKAEAAKWSENERRNLMDTVDDLKDQVAAGAETTARLEAERDEATRHLAAQNILLHDDAELIASTRMRAEKAETKLEATTARVQALIQQVEGWMQAERERLAEAYKLPYNHRLADIKSAKLEAFQQVADALTAALQKEDD
jgi:hypothetical protein